MNKKDIMKLDLLLAWKRVKEDLKSDTFAMHPLQVEFIEQDLENWLAELRNKISNEEYHPQKMDIIDVPKPDWNLRPGSILSMEDMVVYSALILKCIEKIIPKLSAPSNTRRFANVLRDNQLGRKWFHFGLEGWSKFKEESIKLIDEGYKYVLFSDISAFFENIDLGRLLFDLESFKINLSLRNLLSNCLNCWAGSRRRGIPQGFSPSKVLAEIYLNSIDERLNNEGIVCLRYVDDARCFFKNKKDAIKGLHLLTKLYQQKGLNFQTAKTYIKDSESSRKEIDGISSKIKDLNKKWVYEMEDYTKFENPYSPVATIRKANEELEWNINSEVLIKALDDLSQNINKFDKSLFHFLINRLGATNNPHAIGYCLEHILLVPEETKCILNYFSCLNEKFEEIGNYFAELIKNNNLLYDYQYFLILEWIVKNNIKTNDITGSVRKLIGNNNLGIFIFDLCVVYLGNFGDLADLDMLESFYDHSKNSIQKATILYALRRLPTNRRNEIYSRHKNDGEYSLCAIKLAKH